jgi:hypothetical protein
MFGLSNKEELDWRNRRNAREEEKFFNILVEKPEGNNQLGKPKHTNEDDIKIDIKNRMEGRRLD